MAAHIYNLNTICDICPFGVYNFEPGSCIHEPRIREGAVPYRPLRQVPNPGEFFLMNKYNGIRESIRITDMIDVGMG